jgi:hypothetical protein
MAIGYKFKKIRALAHNSKKYDANFIMQEFIKREYAENPILV